MNIQNIKQQYGAEWYNPPIIIPQIGTSDNRAVMMKPTGRGVRCVVKPPVTMAATTMAERS